MEDKSVLGQSSALSPMSMASETHRVTLGGAGGKLLASSDYYATNDEEENVSSDNKISKMRIRTLE
jgi:hypothetical protein